MKRSLSLIIVAAAALITVALATARYRSKRPAPVTLEEFGDFQCPPCGALAGPLVERLSRRAGVKRSIYVPYIIPYLGL